MPPKEGFAVLDHLITSFLLRIPKVRAKRKSKKLIKPEKINNPKKKMIYNISTAFIL
jgi:hypothetical protein